MDDKKEFTTFTFRVEKTLKQEFERTCKAKDQTPSQILRAFMREAVAKYGAEQ